MLFSLPAAVQLKLSRRPPVVVDGCTLHPQMQLLLALRDLWRGAAIAELTPEIARANFRNDTETIYGRPIAVGAITDLAIDAAHGTIAARHYAPTGDGARPLLVYYHGGGFVLGDLDGHDNLCRRICRDADLHVLSVDYRLAPEHPFPAAVDDALAAFRFGPAANAAALGARGEGRGRWRQRRRQSRGGGRAENEGFRRPGALRADPALSGARPHGRAGRRSNCSRDGFIIGRNDIAWYHLHYTGSAEPPAPTRRCIPCSPRISPASRPR